MAMVGMGWWFDWMSLDFKLNRAISKAWSLKMFFFFFLWTLVSVNCVRAAIWGVT